MIYVIFQRVRSFSAFVLFVVGCMVLKLTSFVGPTHSCHIKSNFISNYRVVSIFIFPVIKSFLIQGVIVSGWLTVMSNG